MIDSARLFRAKAPLLAASSPQSDPDSHLEGLDALDDTASQETVPSPPLETESSRSSAVAETESVPADSPDLADFERLQRRLILATLLVSAIAVPATALIYDLHIASSLLVGGLAGALYLRLLARSVAKLGNGSKKVGKFQLLVPVVLVLAAARLPQLELLPALLGFLLYKPAVILQALTDR